MPRQQDIDQFKRDLAALSHEAEVLARWGETPEGADAARETAGPAAAEESIPPDFAELLEELPLGGERPAAAPADEDAELAALLGPFESPAGERPEEAFPVDEALPVEEVLPAEEAPARAAAPLEELEPALPQEEEAVGTPGGLEEFSIPEPSMPEAGPSSEGEDFSFDLAAFAEPAEGAPERAAEEFSFEPPVPPPEAGEAAPTREGPESYLSFEEPAAASAPAEGPEASEAVPEEAASETVAVEELGSEPLPEGFEPGGEMTAFEEPAAAGTGAFGGLEDFSIPDLEPKEQPAREAAPLAGGSAEAAPAALPADAFESFSFEDSGAGAEFQLPSIGAASTDLDEEIASLGEEVVAADTFKLDQEWGGFEAAGPSAVAPPRPAAPRIRPEPPSGPVEEFKPVSLTEQQVDSLQDSLLSYPLNLRIAIEDALANGKGTEAQRSRLVWAMVEGASPEDAAALAGKALKRRIEVPQGYRKRTGAALEAKKGTLAYAFIRTFLPALWIGFIVMAAAGLVGYLGWRFVYIPLSANALYRTGYERIAEDRYLEAEDAFAKATKTKEYIVWYYRYAEAYAAKRQYMLAERKYASLIERYPKETEGILAWARLEREQLKYEEAVKVLKGVRRRAG